MYKHSVYWWVLWEGQVPFVKKKQFTVPHLLMINQRGSYGSMVCHIYQFYPQAANHFDSPAVANILLVSNVFPHHINVMEDY